MGKRGVVPLEPFMRTPLKKMSDLHKFNGECVGEPVDPGIVAEHVVEGAGTTWTMRLTEGEIYCLYDKVTPAGHPNRVVFQAVLRIRIRRDPELLPRSGLIVPDPDPAKNEGADK